MPLTGLLPVVRPPVAAVEVDPVTAALAAGVAVALLGTLVGLRAWSSESGAVESTPEEDRDRTAPASEDADASNLLTDRERIRRLLYRQGGRAKQSRIVTDTGWSKAKVSRLLSQMEEDGEISKIRLGRENLICLRGMEPDIVPT